jgi:hypothetical protein
VPLPPIGLVQPPVSPTPTPFRNLPPRDICVKIDDTPLNPATLMRPKRICVKAMLQSDTMVPFVPPTLGMPPTQCHSNAAGITSVEFSERTGVQGGPVQLGSGGPFMVVVWYCATTIVTDPAYYIECRWITLNPAGPSANTACGP